MSDIRIKPDSQSGILRLHYYIEDMGDGSTCARFFATAEEAEKAEKDAEEEFGQGWAEPSASYVDIEII